MTNRIQEVSAVFNQERAAFMPYFTMGYPDMNTSLDVISSCVENGADLIELGIPFSDPLADGPTIQHSTQVALQNGTSVVSCLEGVKQLREKGITIPLILMGYYNPILAYGLEKFVSDAFSAGANGFIIPDLPPDEASELIDYCQQYGLAMVFMLSPNSPDERIKLVTTKSSGFIYLVSVMGITGERTQLSANLEKFVTKVRAQTDKPLVVGFGISTPDQAQSVAQVADGVIVGSALIKIVESNQNKPQAAGQFVKSMVEAIQSQLEENKS